jgi:hypothetical protein
MANKIIVTVELDPSKDIAKVPAGAIPRGVVATTENIVALFEAEEGAAPKAIEFKYISPNEVDDISGFQYVGFGSWNDGVNITLVYSREM